MLASIAYRTRRLVTVISMAALVIGSAPMVAPAQDGVVRKDAGVSAVPGIVGGAAGTASSVDPRQERKEGEPQEPSQITRPLALSPEITRQRVGVDENQRRLLTLQEAIALALQNNLDIEMARQSVQIAQHNLFSARGAYDILSGAEIGYRDGVRPVVSIFAGGDQGGSVGDKSVSYSFTTGQNIEATGGNYQLDFTNARSTTTATFSQLTTQFNTSLAFTFTQPLMRNFKLDANRRNIQLFKRSLDLSDSQFRQQVIDIISGVQRAYWDLVFSIRNEEIARETVELTKTQLDNNRKMVDAGTLAPIELRSTEAALESRKESVIIALQSITTAENSLKALLIKDPGDSLWNSSIVPTDEPQFGQVVFSLEEATQLALRNRPELEQMELEKERNKIDIRYFENQTKPQVDLVASLTSTGLAGEASTLVRDGVPLGADVPDRFIGGYSQSLKNLFGYDFRTYQVGVRLSFPWRNRTAEGNLGRALAESRQLDARQRQTVQGVQIEVRNALQAVEAARQRYEAAQANRIAAMAQYQGEQEKFRAGLSTNFFVLDRQNALSVARGSEVRALTDYNKALADLQRVTGMTLTSNNVDVEVPKDNDK